jgi:hypothetical protein
MKTISPLRFGIWVTLICAGVLLLMFGYTTSAILILGLSGLLLISRSDMTRAMTSGQTATIFIFLLVILGLIVGSVHLVPYVTFRSIMTHPAVVIPLWLGVIVLVYRRWHHDRSCSDPHG